MIHSVPARSIITTAISSSSLTNDDYGMAKGDVKRRQYQPHLSYQSSMKSRLLNTNTDRSEATTTTIPPKKDDTKQTNNNTKGTILVLGGTGYLGQYVCVEALTKGYNVISLSRRGIPKQYNKFLSESDQQLLQTSSNIDYRIGDVRQKQTIDNILLQLPNHRNTKTDDNNNGTGLEEEEDTMNLVGIVHCIGLLFDSASGLGDYNIFVSGSKSIPDTESTYDAITRVTAYNAIDAAIEYVTRRRNNDDDNNNDSTTRSIISRPLPFVFTSAAEAGWPQMTGGPIVEQYLMPEFIQRYMVAKRAVESKLLSHVTIMDDEDNDDAKMIRPVIVRPSLIYNPYQLESFVPVTAFTILNQMGVPFVDRPVTVTTLAKAIIQSIANPNVSGIQRYMDLERLGSNNA